MPIFLKSGSLNLLEPSGPVQACSGIAFFIYIYIYIPYIIYVVWVVEDRTDVAEVRDKSRAFFKAVMNLDIL